MDASAANCVDGDGDGSDKLINPLVHNMQNPFIPFNKAHVTIEEAIATPLAEWRLMYRRLALKLHPDKQALCATAEEVERSTEAFQRLEHSKALSCQSLEKLAYNARVWLLTQRETRQRLQERALAKKAKLDREEAESVDAAHERPEHFPGIVLLQGQLSQALRYNQRWRSGAASSSQETRLVAMESAENLMKIRAKVFEYPKVSRHAPQEEKDESFNTLARNASSKRAERKLRRALDTVTVHKAKCNARNMPYEGPSEAAWKRRAWSWLRAGCFAERMKPLLAGRRLRREARRAEELEADPDHRDNDEHGVRGDWRRYRRELEQRGESYMEEAGPPKRGRKNSERRKKQRQNYRQNRKVIAVCEAAKKVFFYKDVGNMQICNGDGGDDFEFNSIEYGPNSDGIVLADVQTEAVAKKKHKHRGGKATQRLEKSQQE